MAATGTYWTLDGQIYTSASAFVQAYLQRNYPAGWTAENMNFYGPVSGRMGINVTYKGPSQSVPKNHIGTGVTNCPDGVDGDGLLCEDVPPPPDCEPTKGQEITQYGSGFKAPDFVCEGGCAYEQGGGVSVYLAGGTWAASYIGMGQECTGNEGTGGGNPNDPPYEPFRCPEGTHKVTSACNSSVTYCVADGQGLEEDCSGGSPPDEAPGNGSEGQNDGLEPGETDSTEPNETGTGTTESENSDGSTTTTSTTTSTTSSTDNGDGSTTTTTQTTKTEKITKWTPPSNQKAPDFGEGEGNAFYTSKYPDGISEIWTRHQPGLMATPMMTAIQDFIPNIGGGSCPNFTMTFNLGIANFGSHQIDIDCNLLIIIGNIILLTAAFGAYKIIW